MKSIFITGGTTGIGLALAESYLREGHWVGLCGRDLTKLPQGFCDRYPKVMVYEADVLDRKNLEKRMKEFVKKSGEGLGIVIANAGVSVGDKSPTPNFEDARKVMAINVEGVLNTFEVAFELMQPQGRGHLVAISSVAGFVGLPGAGPYSASKAAVLKLCESFAIDFKRWGLEVTAIAPGFIKTPLTDRNNHAMPFIISADKAAQKIKWAIDRKKRLFLFPWPMAFIVTLLDKMPRWLYRWVMSWYVNTFQV